MHLKVLYLTNLWVQQACFLLNTFLFRSWVSFGDVCVSYPGTSLTTQMFQLSVPWQFNVGVAHYVGFGATHLNLWRACSSQIQVPDSFKCDRWGVQYPHETMYVHEMQHLFVNTGRTMEDLYALIFDTYILVETRRLDCIATNRAQKIELQRVGDRM